MINFTKDFEIFNKENLGQVRTLQDEYGTIWFVATDVCNVLELKNTTDSLKRLDDDQKYFIDGQKNSFYFKGRHGGGTGLNLINESGIYNLILNSRKPQAKDFTKWITLEVIPSIRKNGGYIYGQEKLNEQEKASLQKEIQSLSLKVQKLRERRHELIEENSQLKEEKRHFKKEVKALNEYADIFENLYDKTLADYKELMEENEVLRNRIDRMKHPEVYKEPEIGPRIFVSKDGLIIPEEFLCQEEMERDER